MDKAARYLRAIREEGSGSAAAALASLASRIRSFVFG